MNYNTRIKKKLLIGNHIRISVFVLEFFGFEEFNDINDNTIMNDLDSLLDVQFGDNNFLIFH
jgi:hypothetical protein